MKKYGIVLVGVVMSLMLASVAMAESKKCNAIPWGEALTAVEQIEFSHAAGDIRYYTVTKVEACGIAKIEDTRVTYGFRENKLFTTIVEIEKAKDIKKVISILMDEYGLPDHKKDEGWDVYKWETDTLKIKLKSQYSTDRIKIGMYYKPLIPKE
ncbi:hypothetical protein OAN24_06550 [Pseudodesulfovibrio sp.]|nr:hypothetical protein [Pseudodesulfovibrio sp.]